MTDHTNTRAARKVQSTTNSAPAANQRKDQDRQRHAGKLSHDGSDRIEIGDTVATNAGQGGDVGGVVVATFDEIVVFKTDHGSFDVQDRDGLFVVSKAQEQRFVTGKTHRFEVGDTVTDANNEVPNGIVVAVVRNAESSHDVVVWMEADGSCAAWYAYDVELVTKGPSPDTSKMIDRRRIDRYPPGSAGQKSDLAVADRAALQRLIGVKELHRPGDEHAPATLERMTAAAHKLERARQLVQQIEDLIVTPTMSPDEIGWDWADALPADWAFAYVRALRHEISDLQAAAHCAIAVQANEARRQPPEPSRLPSQPVHQAGIDPDRIVTEGDHQAFMVQLLTADHDYSPGVMSAQDMLAFNKALFSNYTELSALLSMMNGRFSTAHHLEELFVQKFVSLGSAMTTVLGEMMVDAVSKAGFEESEARDKAELQNRQNVA